MKVTRFFTQAGGDVWATSTYERRDCRLTRAEDGTTVFLLEGIEVPVSWSGVASDILISKYLRKAGVPQKDEQGEPLLDEEGKPILGAETSIRQVIGRLAQCWRSFGTKYGYFASSADAEAFEDEISYMLLHQMAAPNSPQWFNTGLHTAYGIEGAPQGHWYVDPKTERMCQATSAYERPQPHACFIQSLRDDLVGEGGIMDLWVREARLFKYGSGTGTNFSCVRGRGEPLSGGGTSSGLLSFLKIGDRAAGAIKSGGTTRRAAKMVCVDIDHPDIESFILWKANEEKKVRALVAGGYSSDFDGEAYETVSGQHANNSVRLPNEFFAALAADEAWALRNRTSGEVAKELPARELWQHIGEATWASGDPGVQYDGTINEWHTTPAGMDGQMGAPHNRIRASNPCSEYMFLDDTACNLASLNLVAFCDAETGQLDLAAFRHACRLWTLVLEISVAMAQYPSKEIALNSHTYRTLGLGYANLGSLLMRWGFPYDAPRSHAITAAITSLMTGVAYATSAEMAKHQGPFAGFANNRESMLRVIRNHRRATYNEARESYEGLTMPPPQGIDEELCLPDLLAAARDAWDEALAMGMRYGYRNAQTTLLAPTGTIGLLMDCDTTGIEPDFSLVKWKKLTGGGYFKIANRSLQSALRNLGYSEAECTAIEDYVIGTASFQEAPHVNTAALLAKGFSGEDLVQLEGRLGQHFSLASAFHPLQLGTECLERIGLAADVPDVLKALGFEAHEIQAAERHVLGHMHVEGAPHLAKEYYEVFDTAQGKRFLAPMAHVRMLAAAQPYLSGAISKTVNLPHTATVEEILDVYQQGWEMGLKALALYRDGSKQSQPLMAKAAEKETGSPSKRNGRSERLGLPAKRDGFTQEARIAGQKIFVRTGEYEDGTLGEIFLDMHKAGSTMRGLLDAFAVAVSLGLQYGVPLRKYVDSMTFTRFEPAGSVEHANIRMATSVIDYVFRLLGMEYLERTDFIHVPPEPGDLRVQRAKRELPASATASRPLPPREEGETSVRSRSARGSSPLCIECGGMMRQNGSCHVCLDCGTTTGCS